MTLPELCRQLSSAGIELGADKTSRRIACYPAARLTPMLRAAITVHREQLVDMLLGPATAGREHFCIVQSCDENWPTFIHGFHYAFAQPSRLAGICTSTQPCPKEHA